MYTTVAARSPVPKGSVEIRERSLSPMGEARGARGSSHRARAVLHEPCDLRRPSADRWIPATDYSAILYSSSRRRPTIIFWISAVPSPISSIGASRYSRSISYSLEKP